MTDSERDRNWHGLNLVQQYREEKRRKMWNKFHTAAPHYAREMIYLFVVIAGFIGAGYLLSYHRTTAGSSPELQQLHRMENR